MTAVAVLILLIGVYGLCNGGKVMALLDRAFYKRQREVTKRNRLAVGLLALLWILVALMMLLKSIIG